MPLPSERVQALRAAYDDELALFEDFSLDASAVERAMRRSDDERIAALEALMDSEPRRAMLEPLAEAIRAEAEAGERYEAVRAENERLLAEMEPEPTINEDGDIVEGPEPSLPADRVALESEALMAAGEAAVRVDESRVQAIRLSVEPEDLTVALGRDADPDPRDGREQRPGRVAEHARGGPDPARGADGRAARRRGAVRRRDGRLGRVRGRAPGP